AVAARIAAPAPAPVAAPPPQPTTTTTLLLAPPRRHDQEAPAEGALAIWCLGSFRVSYGGRSIDTWAGQKGLSILKYLVVHRRVPVAKDVLMELFWPEMPPESARRNLHQAIYSLRQSLKQGGPELQAAVSFENDCYKISDSIALWVDYERFEEWVGQGRRHEAGGDLAAAMACFDKAVDLYAGDFLAEDLYEDWLQPRREKLAEMRIDVVERLSQYHYQRGDFTAATAYGHQILASDACREETHYRLMECYLAQGKRHLALRQYQSCVEVLEREFGLAPSAATQALYQRILADERPAPPPHLLKGHSEGAQGRANA
ncbi:MAG: hypothetical protein HGB28_06280, partial [Oscillochloris sp.]|nr:hypothetical protein [Oscillochloris sp.]